MRKYLSLLIVLFFATIASAQINYQDVVYLKNGSIIHGLIVEQIPNKSLKIETADNNIFVFQIDEVEKITKEKAVEKQNKVTESNYYQKIRPKFMFSQETSFGIDEDYTMYALDAVFGTQFNPYIFLGVGFAVHSYDNTYDVYYTSYPYYNEFYEGPIYLFHSMQISSIL